MWRYHSEVIGTSDSEPEPRIKTDKELQTLIILAGKLKEILAILAKEKGKTLGEYARLREKEINLADMGALDADADRRED